ncbi:MAG: hypothetical protein EA369_09775 [Bradymonadales bacterium]|nr:MAG: hypothetical protein EA369_09775 [Bradymonadales bacterium]
MPKNGDLMMPLNRSRLIFYPAAYAFVTLGLCSLVPSEIAVFVQSFGFQSGPLSPLDGNWAFLASVCCWPYS